MAAEDFAVMKYACSNCDRVELVWNSREGVTPFSIPCETAQRACPGVMSHVDWHLDSKRRKFQLRKGMRYFVTLTLGRAEVLAKEVCDKALQEGRLHEDDYAARMAKLALSFYKDGHQPDLLTFTPEHEHA